MSLDNPPPPCAEVPGSPTQAPDLGLLSCPVGCQPSAESSYSDHLGQRAWSPVLSTATSLQAPDFHTCLPTACSWPSGVSYLSLGQEW